MSQNFIPMIAYEDGLAAMAWLKSVFECDAEAPMVGDDGRLAHGELALDGQRIMLANPTPDYQNPKTVRQNYAASAEVAKSPYIIDGVLVYVSDVRTVFDRAAAHGAVILSEIQEGSPGTRFRMEDPEGHRWYVMQR